MQPSPCVSDRDGETGDVQQKPRGGNNPRRIDLSRLRQQLEARPDDRLIARIEAWERRAASASRSARCGSRSVTAGGRIKKIEIAREADRPDVCAKREAFLDLRPHLDPTKLMFIDESGFRLGSPPNYGWAPLGEKSIGRATHGNRCTMTMIGAIALDGWRGFINIDAPLTTTSSWPSCNSSSH